MSLSRMGQQLAQSRGAKKTRGFWIAFKRLPHIGKKGNGPKGIGVEESTPSARDRGRLGLPKGKGGNFGVKMEGNEDEFLYHELGGACDESLSRVHPRHRMGTEHLSSAKRKTSRWTKK